MMKKLKVILSVLCAATLLAGCGSNTKEQSSTNETKQEEKQEVKREDNVKKEEKKDNKSKKLEELQPGVFKSELARAIDTYEFTSYDDLLRYPKENIDKKVKIMGTAQQVDFAEDGAIEVYLYDNANDRYYFVYYFPDVIEQNVVVGDYITALCNMENVTEISATNKFGVEAKTNVPVLEMEYLLDNSYSQDLKAIGEFLGTENKYQFELAGEAKDFEDLAGKRGYVFSLKSKEDGNYKSEYIFAEKGVLRYYTPTVDGKNINGESTSLSEKSVYGAQ